MNKWASLVSVIAVIPSVSFAAVNLTENFSISGFGSFSATKSDNLTALLRYRDISDDWCLDCDSTFGLQADWSITSDLRASAQLVKRPQDSFSSPELEWAYLAYEYDSFTFRAGRLRLPLFLMSEYYYVSYAYTGFRPPQDIYDSLLGVTSYDGVSMTWEGMIQDTVGVSVTPYWSTQAKDTYIDSNFEHLVDSDYITGMNVQFSYDDTLINISSLFSKYDVDSTHTASGTPLGSSENEMKLFTVGVEQYLGNLHVLLEGMYSKSFYTNWYISMDYPINSLTPYITYGQQRVSESGEQALIGVRYDVNQYIALNLETQFFWAKEAPGIPGFTEGRTSYFSNVVTDNNYDANLITFGISFIF